MVIWDENKKVNEYEGHLLRRANIPMYQWIEDELRVLNTDDTESFRRLRTIRENLSDFLTSDKNNLIICGQSVGCGKTAWAFKMLLTQIENNWKKIYAEEFKITDEQFDIALFLSAVPFLFDLKQFGNNSNAREFYTRAKITDLLVIDDIVSAEMSKYDYTAIYAIVESRNLAHLPTIFTTNCTTKDEMTKHLGVRLTDRIWSAAEIIEIKGPSLRGLTLK